MSSEKRRSGKPSQEEINREVKKLMNKPGWDPRRHVSEQPLEALQRLDQESRNDEIFELECEACLEARTQTGDQSALCAEHLAQAMGF